MAEACDALRAVTGCDEDKLLQSLLRASNYNVQRAANMFFDGTVPPESKVPAHSAPTRKRQRAPSPIDLVALDQENSGGETEPRVLADGFMLRAYATESGSIGVQSGERVFLQFEGAQTKKGKRQRAVTAAYTAANASVVRVATQAGKTFARLNREHSAMFGPLIAEGVVDVTVTLLFAPPRVPVFGEIVLAARIELKSSFFDLLGPNVHGQGMGRPVVEDHGPTALSAFKLICTACKPELLAIVDSAGTKAAAASSSSSSTARAAALSPRPDPSAEPNAGGTDADTEAGRHEAAAAAASNDEARVDGRQVVERVLDTAAPSRMGQAPQPGTLGAQLRPYQRQALHWLVTRERGGEDRDAQQREMQRVAEELWHPCSLHSGGEVYANPYRRVVALEPPPAPQPCFGGMLCDEMGMGKTVELLALLHARMDEDKEWRVSDKEADWIAPRAATAQPKRRRAGTLVVAPMSMLAQWRDEIATHSAPDSLRVVVHYGAERAGGASDAFTGADVVLTTYGVVSSEMGAVARGAPPRLHAPRWRRVVLDEAHLIKNKETETARAVYALHAEHRWCLTGTPLHNSLTDLFSLLHFLRHEPWSEYIWWKRAITDPYEAGRQGEVMERIRDLLGPLVLRRTKEMLGPDGKPILTLPPRHVHVTRLPFSQAERAFYDALYSRSKAEFEGFVAEGTARNKYATIFTLLLRLRQACNHPFLVMAGLSRAASGKGGARNAATLLAKEQRHAGATDTAGAARSGAAPSGKGAAASATGGAAAAGENGAGSAAQSGAARARGEVEGGAEEDNDFLLAHVRRFLASQLKPSERSPARPTAARAARSSAAGADARAAPAMPSGSGTLSRSYMESVLAKLEQGADQECPLCLNPPSQAVITPCAHVFCRTCFEEACGEAGCAVCRTPCSVADVFPLNPSSSSPPAPQSATRAPAAAAAAGASSPSSAPPAGEATNAGTEELLRSADTLCGSTKLDWVVGKLQGLGTERQKAVVFSQWTSMLDLIETALRRKGISFVRLDGSTSFQQRGAVLASFRTDPGVTTLLASTKAGGVGLNLTTASSVVLVDPWWHVHSENQAIDRVHRIGQTQPVDVHRLIIEDSVEERMLELQERKAALARHALAAAAGGEAENESRKLTIDDFKLFFGL